MNKSKDEPRKKGGLAALSKEERRRIASLGGKATPNNFKNNPELARQVALKREADKRRRREEDARK